ncbi:hypothetical protein [Micrococcus luteus]|uniref:hypothetical protein n=1 Tax=Micrococcus luteus TaxID=1270 RepID=UPI003317114B
MDADRMTRAELLDHARECCAAGDAELLDSLDTADTDDLRGVIATCPDCSGQAVMRRTP